MTKTRVLVTVDAGFIGSHLGDELLESNSEIEIVVADNLFLGYQKNLTTQDSSERYHVERVDISGELALNPQ